MVIAASVLAATPRGLASLLYLGAEQQVGIGIGYDDTKVVEQRDPAIPLGPSNADLGLGQTWGDLSVSSLASLKSSFTPDGFTATGKTQISTILRHIVPYPDEVFGGATSAFMVRFKADSTPAVLNIDGTIELGFGLINIPGRYPEETFAYCRLFRDEDNAVLWEYEIDGLGAFKKRVIDRTLTLEADKTYRLEIWVETGNVADRGAPEARASTADFNITASLSPEPGPEPEPEPQPCPVPNDDKRLDGAWILQMDSQAGPMAHGVVYSAQDSTALHYTAIMKNAQSSPSLGAAFPQAGHQTDMIGVAEVTEPNTVQGTLIGYGIAARDAGHEIVSIAMNTYTAVHLDFDTAQVDGVLGYFLAEQDADTDGFPDEDQEPILATPYSATLRRVKMRPMLAPTPAP
jgi:hypothetical protein